MARGRFGGLVAAVVATTALVLIGSPAGATMSLTTASSATLMGDGSVSMAVSYTCPPSDSASVSVRIQQNVKGTTTQGFGSASTWADTLICDNLTRSALVNVVPNSGPGFRTGRAFVNATLTTSTYDADSGTWLQDRVDVEGFIKIVR